MSQRRVRRAPSADDGAAVSYFAPIAAALGHRAFAHYTAGNLASFVGAWMQRIMLAWIVWDLTQSGVWLGVLVLCDLGPALIIGPFGGALGDRMDQGRLILICQALFLSNGLVLAGVAAWVSAPAWMFVAFAFVGGVANALSDAARLSIVRRLTTAETLAAAIALTSVVFNLARFVGPAIGGYAFAMFGAGPSLAVAALLTTPFILVLSRIGAISANAEDQQAPWLGSIVEGFRYVASHAEIMRFFALFALTCLLVRPSYEVMPGIVGEAFGGDVGDFSLVISVAGLGAFVAAVNLSRVTAGGQIEPVIVRGAFGGAAALVGLALAPGLAFACIAAGALGYFISTTANGVLIAAQLRASAAYQARVSSVWTIIVRAGPAIGALAIGAAADWSGFRAPLFAGAVLCAAGAWLILARGRAKRGPGASPGGKDDFLSQ